MKKYYIISNKIVFDPATNRLWSMGNQTSSIALYAPAGQCLFILLQQPDVVFSQRFLFKAIWEKNGLYATANTLYQNVALLRKTLKTLGVDQEVISTIPRQGIKFTGQVEIVEADEEVFEKKETTDIFITEATLANMQKDAISDTNEGVVIPESDEPDVQIPTLTSARENKYKFRSGGSLSALLPATIFILSACSLSYQLYQYYFHEDPIFSNYNYVGDVGGCHLYSTYAVVEVSETKFKKLLGQAGLTCSLRTTAYIALDKNHHIFSVLKCDRDVNDVNADCKTFLFRDLGYEK